MRRLGAARTRASGRAWYTTRVGLEVHVRLALASKLFSPAPAPSADAEANAATRDFDAAVPGTLPRLNGKAVRQATALAWALDARVAETSLFERKHYAYPDLPHGYQITQQRRPLATGGVLRFCVLQRGPDGCGWCLQEKAVGLERLQLEVDSGRSRHEGRRTLVDLNRAGAALVELVMEPTLSSGVEAASAVRELQQMLRGLGVSDGNLEDGSMRADLNVSVTPPEHSGSVPRVEVKNLNSLAQIRQATEHEAARQRGLLESGAAVEQETRTFDPAAQATVRLRLKGGSVDYRYCPEPDLPPLHVPHALVQEVEDEMAQSRREPLFNTRERWHARFGFARDLGACDGDQPALPAESVHATLFFPARASLPLLFDLLVSEVETEAQPEAGREIMVWMEHTVIPVFRAALDGTLDARKDVTTSAEMPAAKALAKLYAMLKTRALSIDGVRSILRVFAQGLLRPEAEDAAVAMREAAGAAAAVPPIDWHSAIVPDLDELLDVMALRTTADEVELLRFAVEALDAEGHEKQLRAVLKGKDQLLKFFFGKAFAASGKRADVKALARVLNEEVLRRRGTRN